MPVRVMADFRVLFDEKTEQLVKWLFEVLAFIEPTFVYVGGLQRWSSDGGVYDLDEEEVRLADPSQGHRRLKRTEFEAGWTGYAALFEYTEALESIPESGARLVVFLQGSDAF